MTIGSGLFAWHGFDVRSVLPADWQAEIERVARTHAKEKVLVPKSVTSREAGNVREVPVETVGGTTLIAELPWLYDLYQGLFRELAEKHLRRPRLHGPGPADFDKPQCANREGASARSPC